MWYLYIILIVIAIILFTKLYIRIRYPFWCKQPVNNEPRAHTWIHEIKLNFIKTWQINPREYHAHTPTIAWTSQDTPPPWKPTIRDCVDNFITGDNAANISANACAAGANAEIKSFLIA